MISPLRTLLDHQKALAKRQARQRMLEIKAGEQLNALVCAATIAMRTLDEEMDVEVKRANLRKHGVP